MIESRLVLVVSTEILYDDDDDDDHKHCFLVVDVVSVSNGISTKNGDQNMIMTT